MTDNLSNSIYSQDLNRIYWGNHRFKLPRCKQKYYKFSFFLYCLNISIDSSDVGKSPVKL